MRTCSRAFQSCTEPAGGYNGRFPELCWKHARTRIVALTLLNRQRRSAVLGGGR